MCFKRVYLAPFSLLGGYFIKWLLRLAGHLGLGRCARTSRILRKSLAFDKLLLALEQLLLFAL